jgi:hypothetical protein
MNVHALRTHFAILCLINSLPSGSPFLGSFDETTTCTQPARGYRGMVVQNSRAWVLKLRGGKGEKGLGFKIDPRMMVRDVDGALQPEDGSV